MSRQLHPAINQTQIWTSPATCPWTREALLRRVGPEELLCAWTTGGPTEPWAGNFTMLSRSTDYGQTWSPAGEFRHPTRGLFTTELFVAQPGEVHAFLQTYGNAVWMTQLNSYRAISRDGGQTWTGPHSIPGGIHNVWVAGGIVHSSGRWIIPVSWSEMIGDEWAWPTAEPGTCDHRQFYGAGNAWADRNHRYCVGVMVSDDQGATFRRCGYLRGGAHGWLIEPRIIELRDGRVTMLIRSQRDGWLWRSESADAGEQWSPAVKSDIPNPAAKVNLQRSRDGRIFLLHNPTVHAGAVMGGRNPLSLWVSDGDMQTWPVKVELVTDDNPSACLNYPDGFIDEERSELHFVWEDMCAVFQVRVPLDIS